MTVHKPPRGLASSPSKCAGASLLICVLPVVPLSPQSAVRGVEQPHRHVYALGNILREQGDALGNQFVPLPVKLRLERRLAKPSVKGLPAHPARFAGLCVRRARRQDGQELQLSGRQLRLPAILSGSVVMVSPNQSLVPMVECALVGTRVG